MIEIEVTLKIKLDWDKADYRDQGYRTELRKHIEEKIAEPSIRADRYGPIRDSIKQVTIRSMQRGPTATESRQRRHHREVELDAEAQTSGNPSTTTSASFDPDDFPGGNRGEGMC